MRGLSMDALCEKVGNVITKQSISKYENGKMLPDSKVLILLSKALEVSIDYFFRQPTVSIDNVEFRKKSKLGVKQIDSIKEIVKDQLERYFEIENLNAVGSSYRPQYENATIQEENDIYPIVKRVKADWQLGEDGINNLIEVLEDNNIKVVEIDAPKSFDGLSGFVNGEIPVIVLNKNFESERKRFTALHELGHLILTFDDCIPDKQVESYCNLFASEMLISKDVFIQRIGAARSDISLEELKGLQIQFGISIDALMYKAKNLNVITESRFNYFHKRKNAARQFKEAVEKNRSKKEYSNRFDRLVYRALASEIISFSKASALLGISVDAIRNQLNLV